MRLAVAVVSCAAAASLFVPCLAGEGDAAAANKAAVTGQMWALRWLKNHQSPDGRWDAKSYSEQCKLNRCEGEGECALPVRSTGLALLAFLGAGETPAKGTCRETVANGLAWLRKAQDERGYFGTKDVPCSLWEHAVAALAMTEASGMTGDEACRASAQKAVSFLFDAPDATGPWRRDFPKDGTVSVKALPWVVFALKSAEMSKLKVDADALTRVVAWLDARTNAATGTVAGPPLDEPNDLLTATGFLTRVFAGHKTATDAKLAPAAGTIAKRPPAWETANAETDPVAWHLGTLAEFQMGGARWDQWKAKARETLLKNQRMEPDRDERGSWEPLGATVKFGGRLETTAVLCLMLSVCAR